ncbi:MAG: hypothetical protein HQL13_07970, partial [Candidatus Omnitrophica bacterium]|nr:hypothetical protein [Candidatus Omnitrophota bacterium]
GEWHDIEGNTLLRENRDGTENRRLRRIWWNTVAQSFLKEFFAHGLPLAYMEEHVDHRNGEGFNQFIEELALYASDTDIITDFLSPEATDNFRDMQIHLTPVLERMLQHYGQKKGVERNSYARLLSHILQQGPEALAKINSLERRNESLTQQEEIYLGLNGILIKESAGTYGSINADPLEHLRNADARLQAISDLVIHRGFWAGVRDCVEEGLDLAKTRGFRTEGGDAMEFELRQGPGYLNMVFGGVSKKNFVSASLLEDGTKGKVILISGDSLTDQGPLPFRFYAHTAGRKGNITREVDELKKTIDKSLADKIEFIWDESKRTGALRFYGEMLPEEHSQIQLALDKRIVLNIKLFKPFREIFDQSNHVSREKMTFRVLLGPIFEADDLLKQRVAQAGLIRTGYTFTHPSPVSLNGLERWGPSAFYPIVNSLIRAAQQGWVIAHTNTEQANARLARAVIYELNRSHETHAKIVPPLAVKQMAKTAAMASPEGGVDLRDIAGIINDPQGVPMNFLPQENEMVQIKSLTPVIYSVVSRDVHNLEEFLANF